MLTFSVWDGRYDFFKTRNQTKMNVHIRHFDLLYTYYYK